MTEPAHRPEPPEHHVAKVRSCLMCRATFASTWAGERICPECKVGKRYERLVALPD